MKDLVNYSATTKHNLARGITQHKPQADSGPSTTLATETQFIVDTMKTGTVTRSTNSMYTREMTQRSSTFTPSTRI